MRYDISRRWPKILAKRLGDSYYIIEEGLKSRTIISDDPRPGKEGRSGHNYLLPCLDSHDPLDLVIVMLGTNELKVIYNKTAEEIGIMLEQKIIKPILTRKFENAPNPKVLILAPPKVDGKLASKKFANKYDETATEKSAKLEKIYNNIAQRNGCHFLSALNLGVGDDGVHLTEESHKELSDRVYDKIKEIFK
jgi:lysophospholipase L1-like esterase